MLIPCTVYICLTHAKSKVYYILLTYYLPDKYKTVQKNNNRIKRIVYLYFSPSEVIFNSLSKKAEVQLQGLTEYLFLSTKPSKEQVR